MSMSAEDLEMCRQAIKTLTSDKYKEKNYLFLQPFDLSQTPGYLDVVSKVLDLSTLSKNLESGIYSNRQEFFADACLIFKNAIAYHGSRAESKWIVKPAKDMLKITQREQKSADKKIEKRQAGSTSSLLTKPPGSTKSLSMISSSSSVTSSTSKKKESSSGKLKIRLGGAAAAAAAAAGGGNSEKSPKSSSNSNSAASTTAPSTEKKPKVSLKLKVGGASSSSSSAAANASATPSSSKSASKSSKSASKKSSSSSSSMPTSTTPAASDNASVATASTAASKPTKLKLNIKPRLKLSIKSKTSSSPTPSSPARSTTPEPPASTTTTTTTATTPTPAANTTSSKASKNSPKNSSSKNSSNKDSSTGKISIKVPAGPRGKELPKGVVAPTSTKSSTAPSSSSSSSSTTKLTLSTSPKLQLSTKSSSTSKGDTASVSSKASKKSTSSKKSTLKLSTKSKKDGTKSPKESSSTIKLSTSSNTTGKTPPNKSASSSTKSSSSKAASSSSSSSSGPKISIKTSSSSAAAAAAVPPPPANRGMMFMTPARKAQCFKVLSGLKRRQQKKCTWFLHPVADKAIVQDYKKKIQHPMDLTTMQTKLEKNAYPTISTFCLDLRRIFANCLRYNTSMQDSLRPIAIQVLTTAEELMGYFLQKPEGSTVVYPPLLSCWKNCLAVLDTLLHLQNTNDGGQTSLYFLHPVSFYCGGEFPHDYLEKVSKPMDFGTVTAQLIEGQYTTVQEFTTDCRLVISNCMAYYGEKEKDGKAFVEQANRLKSLLEQELSKLKPEKKTSPTFVTLPKPSISMLLGILQDLRALKYTDKSTKITEPAMDPFEKPVSLTDFPDYIRFVQTPMDLQTIERKIKTGAYDTAEDFEYDVTLIFKNCEAYNAPRKSDHLVSMGKFGAKHFRKIMGAKMRALEDGKDNASASTPTGGKSNSKKDARKTPPSGAATQGASKKQKTATADSITSAPPATGGLSRTKSGKMTPRISLTLPTESNKKSEKAEKTTSTTTTTSKKSEKKTAASRSKSPKNTTTVSSSNAMSNKSKTTTTSSSSSAATTSASATTTKISSSTAADAKSNQPVPIHIAIARVKEAFPLRRNIKTLESWEADCARYFKELMRHSWIGAARPKFIFHVPVPVLFPELREAYAAKIRQPMDLTTIECTLLAGTKYTSPQDFVSDVALVFANAITFNKDGHDVGDPLSCAYYDASIHLLRYARWLSLELLSDHIEDSDEVDESDGPVPLSLWKLTKGNRKKARQEMEAIVLKEHIDKSLEGDRYTWMEVECEKLLKALRHQSDLRHMTFFIQPNYPPDYAAFISKPMDWESCQRSLKKRQYDKFGDIIDDLRLIFSNALKYNARHAGTDTVSGRAFEAAKYMSNKLENAINKMMLSVSDRLERERIDHANAEREMEAAERAEEERIRAQWKNEKDGNDGNNNNNNGPDAATSSATTALSSSSSSSKSPMAMRNASSNSSSIQQIRSARRTAPRRASQTDFEIPLFDEDLSADNGQHHKSYLELVKQQKSIFERQRQDLSKMQNHYALSIGGSVFLRMMQHDLGMKWLQEQEQQGDEKEGNSNKRQKSNNNESSTTTTTSTTTVDGSKSTDSTKQTTTKSASTTPDAESKITATSLTVPPTLAPSRVLEQLEQSGRGPLQIKLLTKKPINKKKKRKHHAISLD